MRETPVLNGQPAKFSVEMNMMIFTEFWPIPVRNIELFQSNVVAIFVPEATKLRPDHLVWI